MRLSVTVLFAVLAVALAAPSVHQGRQTVPVLGNGPEVPTERVCTKSGEKCAGAKGFPFVVFAPCCDERLVCGEPKSMEKGLWGKFCILSSDAKPGSVEAKSATTAAPSGTTTAPSQTTKASGTTTSSDSTTVAGGAAGKSSPGPTPEGGSGSGLDATPLASDDGDDGSACFPSTATVELKDGSIVPMSQVAIGDMVKVGPSEYSRVFMFTHKMADSLNKFVKLTTASGAELSLTSGHYIYADGSLMAASKVTVGAEVRLGNGNMDKVVAVSSVHEYGLYNPQTVQGDVVVDGIISSTYTTAVEPTFAHAILAPFRTLYTLTGFQFTALEKGGGILADVAPRGAAF